MDGLIQKVSEKKGKKKTEEKEKEKKSKEVASDSDGMVIDEEMLKEAEKNLTPEEKKRIEILHQRESLPMFPYRD